MERERYSAQWPLHRQLTGTVHAIWQKWARAAREDESAFTEAAKWEKEWLRLNNCHAEWVRHANSRITLDVYTQAVNSNKRAAQSKVVKMMVSSEGRKVAGVGTIDSAKQAQNAQ